MHILDKINWGWKCQLKRPFAPTLTIEFIPTLWKTLFTNIQQNIFYSSKINIDTYIENK